MDLGSLFNSDKMMESATDVANQLLSATTEMADVLSRYSLIRVR